MFLGINSYGVYKISTALDKYINEPVIERKDVRGSPKPELFIERNGKIFYSEFDGESIEKLFKE